MLALAVAFFDNWQDIHDIWHLTPDTFYLKFVIWHLTVDSWLLTCEIWHLSSSLWKLIRRQPVALSVPFLTIKGCQTTPDIWQMTPDHRWLLLLLFLTFIRWHMTLARWHMTLARWHLTPDTWHMTHNIWHLTPDMWHLTPIKWHMTPARGSYCCLFCNRLQIIGQTWHLTPCPVAKWLLYILGRTVRPAMACTMGHA